MAEERGIFQADSKKAAMLLISMGEAVAAEILKLMGPKEVQKISAEMSKINSLTKDEVGEVLNQFLDSVEKQTSFGVGTDKYVRNLLISALGEEKGSAILDRISLASNEQGLDSLKWMNSKTIFDLVRSEHPQVIALLLSYIESDQAAELITFFPEAVQSDLLFRVATLDGVQPSAIKMLNETIEKQLTGNTGISSSKLGGTKAVADILNHMDGDTEGAISEKIKEKDEQLCQEIQDLMFVFDNLKELDERAMQTLLREVSNEQLLLAMKATDDELKEKIFNGMSKRAAEMLRDDLEVKGPVKLSEVEVAQKEILMAARKLANEGKILLGNKGEEMI